MAKNPLMTAGVTSALCGVAVAVVASIPGDGVNENQRTGRRPDDPESWSTWLALGLTLACLLWLWTLWSTRPSSRTGRGRRARGVASSVLAAACVAALLVVVLRMPSPGPSGGVDLSLPLMLLAFTLAAIGALGTAMGSLRRPGAVAVDGTTPRRGLRLAASIAPVAAVPLLTVAVAVGVVPSWVVAVNTEGVTTDRPAPAAAAPALTGAVAWSTPPRGEGPSGSAGGLSVIGTAGGLAVLESRGLRMLDPASGTRRWALHRWDVRLLGPRHRPNRVDTGSTAVSPDGRLLATTVFVDRRRTSFIDGLRAATRVWVFDTVSGVLRADFAVPETARIVAVGEGRVTIDLRRARDEPGAGALGMFTFGGETAWRFPMDEGCRPTEVVPVGGDVLTIVSCYSDEEHVDPRHRLVRLRGGDGRPLWSRQVTRDGGKPGAPERFEQVSLAVTDGRPQWWLPDADRTRLRSGEAGERGPLHAAAGRAVFAEEVRTGTGEEARYSTALHAFDVRTGRKSWSHTVLDIEARDLNDAPGPLALLRDGRLFVAYRESTAAGRFKGCAMAAWDITTGQRHGPFQPTAVPREEWCLTSSLEAVEIPGGVAVHLEGGSGAVFVLD
jgi:outer membrane protein assembly factor BamB